MKKEFNHPICIGIVTRNAKAKSSLLLKKRLTAKINDKSVAFLLLETPKSHFSKIRECMTLMDVSCAIVSREYEKEIIPAVNRLDPSAKAAKKVNFIALCGKKLVGIYSEDFSSNCLKK